MILVRFTFTRCHVNEVSMSFSIRPYRRFPLCCPVTYHAGLHEGHGTVWNLSLTGWRLSGDLAATNRAIVPDDGHTPRSGMCLYRSRNCSMGDG